MRAITMINYFITTQCSRSCAECAHGNPDRARDKSIPKNVSWDYINESVPWFKRYAIKLTGGEPTLHPDFPLLASTLKEKFQTPHLAMDTNGFNCIKHIDSLHWFDSIHFSHYIKGDYFSEEEDNTEILNVLKARRDIKLEVFDITHFDSRKSNKKNPCYRSTLDLISYVDGLIYPCCIATGNPSAVGIKPSANWSKEILEVKLKCDNCLFAT